ncbi:tetratricopeptide repeat protein [Myxococcota bacterium]|nr:tetratricopeptide repeat protein [Myxococcota bacterium]
MSGIPDHIRALLDGGQHQEALRLCGQPTDPVTAPDLALVRGRVLLELGRFEEADLAAAEAAAAGAPSLEVRSLLAAVRRARSDRTAAQEARFFARGVEPLGDPGPLPLDDPLVRRERDRKLRQRLLLLGILLAGIAALLAARIQARAREGAALQASRHAVAAGDPESLREAEELLEHLLRGDETPPGSLLVAAASVKVLRHDIYDGGAYRLVQARRMLAVAAARAGGGGGEGASAEAALRAVDGDVVGALEVEPPAGASALAWTARGRAAAVLGDWERAATALRRSVSLGGGPVARLHLARALLARGDRDAARAELEAIRAEGPRFAAAELEADLMGVSDLPPGERLRALDGVAERGRRWSSPRQAGRLEVARARVLAGLGRGGEAAAALEAALRADPDGPDTLLQVAREERRWGRIRDARLRLTGMHLRHPLVGEPLGEWAACLFYADRASGIGPALDRLPAAARSGSGYARALAFAARAEGEPRRAAELLADAPPGEADGELALERAEALIEAGRSPEATTLLERVSPVVERAGGEGPLATVARILEARSRGDALGPAAEAMGAGAPAPPPAVALAAAEAALQAGRPAVAQAWFVAAARGGQEQGRALFRAAAAAGSSTACAGYLALGPSGDHDAPMRACATAAR